MLENVKRPAEAAQAYERSSEAAKNSESRASALASRAGVLVKTGQAKKAEEELIAAVAGEDDPAARSRLWKAGYSFSIMEEKRKETGWEKEQSLLLIVNDDGRRIRIAILNDEGADFRTMEPDDSPSD